jgi:hypothetical protein
MPVNIQLSKISIASTIGKTTRFCELLILLKRSHFAVDSKQQFGFVFFEFWWAQVESNHRPHPYQGCALAN